MVQLRQYQFAGINKIFEAWDPNRSNLKNVLFQMPTGTGKTTVFSEIVRKAHAKNKFVLIVVHRIELVEQIAERLMSFGVTVGIISASTKPDPEKEVQVATIQTLSRRNYPPADIVIIDECHHSKAATYSKLWDIYPEARFLGVTATPVRLNGDGFSDLFQTLIPLGKLSYFFKEGYLARLNHYVTGIPDLSKVKTVMRDYDLHMLKNVMLDDFVMADLVQGYKKFAYGKKTIVFAVDIEHSKKIAERYNEAGVPAIHIDATTPKQERKFKLNQFRTGEIKVLCNVDIVSEGFDVPDCEAVQLARPTKSLALYLQQVGRCMRPAENKESGIVLDNANLWHIHGLSYIDRIWSLDGIKKSKQNPFNNLVAIDQNGRYRRINSLEEAKGLELVEITEDLVNRLMLESFIYEAIEKGHAMSSVAFRFVEYLISIDKNFTEVEKAYCYKRLNQEGFIHKRGYWHYREIEIAEKLSF